MLVAQEKEKKKSAVVWAFWYHLALHSRVHQSLKEDKCRQISAPLLKKESGTDRIIVYEVRRPIPSIFHARFYPACYRICKRISPVIRHLDQASGPRSWQSYFQSTPFIAPTPSSSKAMGDKDRNPNGLPKASASSSLLDLYAPLLCAVRRLAATSCSDVFIG